MEEQYIEALVSAWAFMLLLGLMCCCLSTQSSHNIDLDAANASCSCDGTAYGAV
ncbi:unnamed protein product [Amaranthus hypochondriacus]